MTDLKLIGGYTMKKESKEKVIKQNSEESINPELEREEQEQAIAEGKKTTLLDKGIAPLSSFGSSGLKF